MAQHFLEAGQGLRNFETRNLAPGAQQVLGKGSDLSVSYTHLTLPTNREV